MKKTRQISALLRVEVVDSKLYCVLEDHKTMKKNQAGSGDREYCKEAAAAD